MLRAKRLIFAVIMIGWAVSAAGCHAAESQESDQSLTVFAAASLTDAFLEIGDAFETGTPGVEVIFNFAGSQQLAQQLVQGASGDIFASADRRQMDVVMANGRILSDTSQPFAQNQLVIILPAHNPANITQLSDLARDGNKLIFAAPGVPAGAYVRSFLEKASEEPALGVAFETAVLANIVSYEQSVRAVYSKVALGEADAGIVYASDVQQDGDTAVISIPIPAEINVVAQYPLAPIADSDNLALANAFIQFVLSVDGQAVLEKHGFLPVDELEFFFSPKQ